MLRSAPVSTAASSPCPNPRGLPPADRRNQHTRIVSVETLSHAWRARVRRCVGSKGSNPQVSQQWAANRQEHHSQNHPQASRWPHRNCALHRRVDPTACGLRVLRSLPRRLVQRRPTAFRPATNSRLMLARRVFFHEQSQTRHLFVL